MLINRERLLRAPCRVCLVWLVKYECSYKYEQMEIKKRCQELFKTGHLFELLVIIIHFITNKYTLLVVTS